MKIKTSELSGAALDWAVGQCAYDTKVIAEDGFVYFASPSGNRMGRCSPSTNWSQGGPIIERERIHVYPGPQWTAGVRPGQFIYGPTPLIAAMRCFVACKLGDEVYVSEELL